MTNLKNHTQKNCVRLTNQAPEMLVLNLPV